MNRALLLVIVLTLHPAILVRAGASTQPASAADAPRFYSHVHWGIDFRMEGTVKNVVLADGHVQFQINGRLWMTQYPPNKTEPVAVEVHPKREFFASVTQADPFFAMTGDWRGGAIRQSGDLLKILRSAEARGNSVKFELSEPKMEFGRDQSFTLTHAIVVRATDADLR